MLTVVINLSLEPTTTNTDKMCYKPPVVFTCCKFPPDQQRIQVQDMIPITRLCRHAGKPDHDLYTVSDDFKLTYPKKCHNCAKKFGDDWDAFMISVWGTLDDEYEDYGRIRVMINNVIETVKQRVHTLKLQFYAELELVTVAWFNDIGQLHHLAAPDNQLKRPRPWRMDYENYEQEYKRLGHEFRMVIAHALGDD